MQWPQCPVCSIGKAAPLLAKDFNISCNDYFEGARTYPLSGSLVHFVECSECGFAWIPELHLWTHKQFRDAIYNEDYILCDPHFAEIRPRKLAAWLATFARGMRVLDYGGGEGATARELRRFGVDAVCWDPFYISAPPPKGPFDLVTAFEVVEHVPDQVGLFSRLAELCGDGLLVFSTLLRPRTQKGDWWYACARNGHVSLHTEESLSHVAGLVGMQVHTLDGHTHVAARRGKAIAATDLPAPIAIGDVPSYRLELETGKFHSVMGADPVS
ncbi:class I SAM-dependent methyltransferase [Arenibaculum pallidiluteum]|uniref:class I SAM-dependent methyltransferase n=1 Tax=Arenibaculum pallidiluteum TaxID=2812559 RepID=UPI001A9772E5|nr:class I SAM-dependent methyltransferase [Arenibaculum pallidiluteum]